MGDAKPLSNGFYLLCAGEIERRANRPWRSRAQHVRVSWLSKISEVPFVPISNDNACNPPTYSAPDAHLDVRCWPILLQKSIFADDQNSAGRGRDFRIQDARDITASRKIHRRL